MGSLLAAGSAAIKPVPGRWGFWSAAPSQVTHCCSFFNAHSGSASVHLTYIHPLNGKHVFHPLFDSQYPKELWDVEHKCVLCLAQQILWATHISRFTDCCCYKHVRRQKVSTNTKKASSRELLSCFCNCHGHDLYWVWNCRKVITTGVQIFHLLQPITLALGAEWVCLCTHEGFVRQQQGQTMLGSLVEYWSILNLLHIKSGSMRNHEWSQNW